MIVYTPANQRTLLLFRTPFEAALRPENRWVWMAEIVSWDEMAKLFLTKLSVNQGRPTVDLRIILGALMVAHIEDLSDVRAIEYIQENIYAQYFVGLPSFQPDPVFVPSLFAEIRKRLGAGGAAELNERLINEVAKLEVIKHRRKSDDGHNTFEVVIDTAPKTSEEVEQDTITEEVKVGGEQVEITGKAVADSKPGERNRGQMAIDARVAPVHISFPTDTALLANCRRQSERLLDTIFERFRAYWPVKPRTYRRDAEKKSTNFSKKRRKTKKDIRRALKSELACLQRNISHLHAMLDLLDEQQQACPWSHAAWRVFWIIQEIYRQQREMYASGRRSVKDRIVSIHMPFIRPIKRGKGGTKNTEFGPKINATITEGFAWSHRMDFNAFNESCDLPDQVEGYRRQFGYYPALVLADEIYWTNANRKWLKERDIKMNARPKGRKPKNSKYKQEKLRKRNNQRNVIEGKFGEGKNRYGLDNLRTRLPATIGADVHLTFLAMNLAKYVREIESGLFSVFYGIATWLMRQKMPLKVLMVRREASAATCQLAIRELWAPNLDCRKTF